jgi:hypothetical protein
MDQTIWVRVRALIRELDADPRGGRYTFSDADIALTQLWAVLHGKPVSWACRPRNWPIWERRVRRPSPSRMSRRLRTAGVTGLLAAAEAELKKTPRGTLALAIDGKAMTVARHSQDRCARFGAFGLRGYKLHLVCDLAGQIRGWRVTPLHCHEAVIARRILGPIGVEGYVLADANYDAIYLHELCARTGGQLVTPRARSRVGKPLDRRRDTPQRQRSTLMLELDLTGFGKALYSQRRVIERTFARLELNHRIGQVPSHVRGLRRVRLWMQAVILLDLARADALAARHHAA